MAVPEKIESLQVSTFYPGSQIASANVPRSIAIAAGPLKTITGGVEIRTHVVSQIAVETSAGLPPFVSAGECPMYKQCAVACFACRAGLLRSSQLAQSRVLWRNACQRGCRDSLHKRIFAPRASQQDGNQAFRTRAQFKVRCSRSYARQLIGTAQRSLHQFRGSKRLGSIEQRLCEIAQYIPPLFLRDCDAPQNSGSVPLLQTCFNERDADTVTRRPQLGNGKLA
jgi:hypothetical protein